MPRSATTRSYVRCKVHPEFRGWAKSDTDAEPCQRRAKSWTVGLFIRGPATRRGPDRPRMVSPWRPRMQLDGAVLYVHPENEREAIAQLNAGR